MTFLVRYQTISFCIGDGSVSLQKNEAVNRRQARLPVWLSGERKTLRLVQGRGTYLLLYFGPHELCIIAGGPQNQLILS